MTKRLVVFVALVAIWLVVVGARLYELQVSRYEEFVERAIKQQTGFVDVAGPRGTIFDRRGRELAVSVDAESAVGVPKKIKDPSEVAARVAAVLGIDGEEQASLERRLSSDRHFVWVARKLDPLVAERVRELGIDGIRFERESRRYYPFRTLLAQVLGYAGIDSQGLSGLEFKYDKVIAGSTARRRLLHDALDGASLADHRYGFTDPEPGQDLHLTIDASLQHIAEKELKKAVETFDAVSGTVVMLDPADSAVLAMASYPTFDPNDFANYDEDSRLNRAIVDAFEPGSTFKMVTAAAVFEAGVVELDDMFFCENGGIQLGRTYIGDHKAFAELSFREVMAKSSNVGVIKASQLLTAGSFYTTIRSLGFGRRTGIDLPGESSGILHPLETWTDLSKAFVSFGQGVAVSPLQLTNAYAAVANGGRLHTPYVVRALGKGGAIEPLPLPSPVGILSPKTIGSLVEMLEEVVANGTGVRAGVPGFRVGGKTGTAQKTRDGGGYSQDKHVASFVGIAPSRRPRLVCLVMLDEPKVSIHGSEVAAPAFAAIVRQSLLYLGVAPDRDLWTTADAWMRPGAGARERLDRWVRSEVDFEEPQLDVALEAGS